MASPNDKLYSMTVNRWNGLKVTTKHRYASTSGKLKDDPLKALLGNEIYKFRKCTPKEEAEPISEISNGKSFPTDNRSNPSIVMLANQNEILSGRIAKLESQLEDIQWDLDQETEEKEDKEAQIQTLRETIQKNEQRMERLSKRITARDEKLTKLDDDILILKADLAREREERCKENQSLSEKLELQNKRNRELSVRFDSHFKRYENDMTNLRDDFNSLSGSLKDTIESSSHRVEEWLRVISKRMDMMHSTIPSADGITSSD